MATAEVNEVGRHYTLVSEKPGRRRREIRTAQPAGRAVHLLNCGSWA